MCGGGGGVRWAFDAARWSPGRPEWLAAVSRAPAGERERIRQFRYLHDAKSSLVGVLLARLLGRAVLGPAAAGEGSLVRDARGRPGLAGAAAAGWDFNVSHQGSFVVLAAEGGGDPGVRVGVDVMRAARERPSSTSSASEFFRLMRRQFTDREWEFIRGEEEKGEDAQMARFFRMWCLKESFVKAEGSGLAWDLRRIDFRVASASVPASDSALEVDGEPQGDWRFEETALADRGGAEHLVCVAVNRRASAGSAAPRPFEVLPNLARDVLERLDVLPGCDDEAEWAAAEAMEKVKPFVG